MSVNTRPCLLLLGSDMRTVEFWLLLLIQELNSAAKNTGKYDEWYVAVFARLHCPVKEEEIKLWQEQRSVLAPCDNIAELTSPLVIILAIGLEAVFDVLPVERAPHLARTGIMGGWRNQRFRGEAPIMMTIAFVVRVMFCWLEINVRAYQRRRDNASISATNIELQLPHGSGGDNRSPALTRQTSLTNLSRQASLLPMELYRSGSALPAELSGLYRRGAAAMQERRSSFAVLYHHVVRSEDALVQMKYVACILFILQMVTFVISAAIFGAQSD